jgi:hypothetical protein
LRNKPYQNFFPNLAIFSRVSPVDATNERVTPVCLAQLTAVARLSHVDPPVALVRLTQLVENLNRCELSSSSLSLLSFFSLLALSPERSIVAAAMDHLDFSVFQTLQWFSMPSNHLQFAVIKYALFLASTIRCYEPI